MNDTGHIVSEAEAPAVASLEPGLPVEQVAKDGNGGDYSAFIASKSQLGGDCGFEPVCRNEKLFGFQTYLTEKALRKGRSAIFADCGLGKTPMQLTWAQNVVEKTSGRALILTPLAVGAQTVEEGKKFGVECARSRDGSLPDERIVITNYEKLHLFKPEDFSGVVCDESSILKSYSGETKRAVTRFMLKVPYRLLCTATPSPNDYVELGTSAEALGEIGYSEMLERFFVMTEKIPHSMGLVKQQNKGRGQHFAKLSFRVHQAINKWTLKGHAEDYFWRWICSWASACRMPSDVGFENESFVLPQMIERQYTVEPSRPAEGYLFSIPAVGLNEERDERRRTLKERCELAANLAAHKDPVVIWCHLNSEGDELERLIPDAIQVSGADSDDEKETAYRKFGDGTCRALIIKPKIGAWGMNWQHCAHVITFATHSYEQYYQATRRCWRFGQKRPVVVDSISTTAEVHVRESMLRKSQQAKEMFKRMVMHMNHSVKVERLSHEMQQIEKPAWI